MQLLHGEDDSWHDEKPKLRNKQLVKGWLTYGCLPMLNPDRICARLCTSLCCKRLAVIRLKWGWLLKLFDKKQLIHCRSKKLYKYSKISKNHWSEGKEQRGNLFHSSPAYQELRKSCKPCAMTEHALESSLAARIFLANLSFSPGLADINTAPFICIINVQIVWPVVIKTSKQKIECHHYTLLLNLSAIYNAILAPIEYPTSVILAGATWWISLCNISAIISSDNDGSSEALFTPCNIDFPWPGRSIEMHLADSEKVFMIVIQSSPLPRKPWRNTSILSYINQIWQSQICI